MISSSGDSRFIIGIDLGTTNSVVSYVDRNQKKRSIENFPVLQSIASGEQHQLRSLPSFCYLPLPHEIENGTTQLPWEKVPSASIGTHARDYGSGIPERFINSAKSWLAHKGIDRLAGTLPWGSEIPAKEKLSPVTVSRFILDHIRQAWNNDKGKLKDNDGTPCTLENSQVIVTVPASFDETARELTVTAAREAGFKNFTLLEEPLAAFYAWLDKTTDWQKYISPGETVLIVDIGGGTTDFSLIEFNENNSLNRTAVGNHLLLGGDNIDMTLARIVESQFKRKLQNREWSILCQRCRQAKEELLSPNGKKEVTVSIATSGSALIGNTLSGKLTQAEVIEKVLEGFYPIIGKDAPTPEKKGGIRDLGLPYERDPSISAHLLSFLKKAGQGNLIIPDKVLFNGGSMTPQILRERLIQLLSSWSDKTCTELPAWNLDEAVSAGATYYGLVRSGEGVRVQGGIARAYYLEIAKGENSELLCIMPRNTEEGKAQQLSGFRFQVKTNEALRFPIHSSATRLDDFLGSHPENRDEISELPSLITSLQFGKTKQAVEVELSTILNETGTLEVWLNSTSTQHRWPLKFDMRALHSHSDDQEKAAILNPNEAVAVTEEQISLAKKAIEGVFIGNDKPGTLIKDLENIFNLNRDKWPLQLIRQMADWLLTYDTFTSAPIEARWMNLTGFCLRPGFGDSNDEYRIKQLWSRWFKGPNFKTDAQTNAEWWVLWRRIAPGLNSGRQEQVAHALFKSLMPNDAYKKNTKYGAQEKMESWRCLGALERISQKLKGKINDIQSERISRLEDFELWSLARINARHLFYGPVDLTTPAKQAASLAKLIMMANKEASKMVLFTLIRIAAKTGEAYLDLPEKLIMEIIEYCKSNGADNDQIKHLTEVIEDTAEETGTVLGDTLPLGLELKTVSA